MVWMVASLVVGASLLARHLVPLAKPGDEELARSMASLRRVEDVGRLMAVHVIYAGCRCSQLIASHLATTVRPSNVAEHVLLAGRDPELAARLVAKGFVVHETDVADVAARWHVPGVPLLVIVAAGGSVLYSGGYTERKQGPAPQDRELIATVTSGGHAGALPVYGCAVSKRLRDELNPFGLP
jgi:hypothetical protein